MLNEVPAAVEHEFCASAVQCESQAPPDLLEEDGLARLFLTLKEPTPRLYPCDFLQHLFRRPLSVPIVVPYPNHPPLLLRSCTRPHSHHSRAVRAPPPFQKRRVVPQGSCYSLSDKLFSASTVGAVAPVCPFLLVGANSFPQRAPQRRGSG